jgi:hypothetical protein
VQPSEVERLDFGITIKDVEPTRRFEAAAPRNSIGIHRVLIDDPKQIYAEVLAWFNQAYNIAE